jgi:phosphoglycerate-specific signal transduction histidine kinase
LKVRAKRHNAQFAMGIAPRRLSRACGRSSARKEVDCEPIDLNDAAQEVITLSMSELQSDRILLRHDFAENLPPVKGDRIQIQQVILNLEYLSTIDAAGRKADDEDTVECRQEGTPWRQNSVALLMCSPEWCERHFRKGARRLCQSALEEMHGSPR